MTIDNDLTRICDVYKNGHQDLIVGFIISELSDFCSMLPQQKTITPQAVILMGKSFAENPDVKNLSFTELKTFLSLALKRMKYGKLYGGFGYDTLIDWFTHFYNERVESIIDYRESKHSFYTQNEKVKRYRSEGDSFGANSIKDIIKK
jgi:hypothetical protein